MLFEVVAGGYAAGWISGGLFNPAIAIAMDVCGVVWSGGSIFWCLPYMAAELLGHGERDSAHSESR